jgi:hypothetical protein
MPIMDVSFANGWAALRVLATWGTRSLPGKRLRRALPNGACAL